MHIQIMTKSPLSPPSAAEGVLALRLDVTMRISDEAPVENGGEGHEPSILFGFYYVFMVEKPSFCW